MKREDGKGRKFCEEFVDPPTRPQDFANTDMLEVTKMLHQNMTFA